MLRCLWKHIIVSFTEHITVRIIAQVLPSCEVLTRTGQLRSRAFNSGAGWLCPATVRVSQKTLLFTATATLKLSATGRRAAPLDSLDVYNPKTSLQCHFEEVWVSHSPLPHKLMPCVTSILIPDLSFSDVKAFWQPGGSSGHQLSRHLRNDAAEGCGLLRSSFTNTPLSDLSVSPASPSQTEGHLLPR